MNWEPIETGPKDRTSILVWDGHSISIAKYCSLLERWIGMAGGEDGNVYDESLRLDPISWMPLPEPPK